MNTNNLLNQAEDELYVLEYLDNFGPTQEEKINNELKRDCLDLGDDTKDRSFLDALDSLNEKEYAVIDNNETWSITSEGIDYLYTRDEEADDPTFSDADCSCPECSCDKEDASVDTLKGRLVWLFPTEATLLVDYLKDVKISHPELVANVHENFIVILEARILEVLDKE